MANLLDNPKSCKELGVPENMAAHGQEGDLKRQPRQSPASSI